MPALDIAICALRYACILSRGQHWNIPYRWYDYLYRKYRVTLEGFSSPFNSQLKMIEYLGKGSGLRFCSLFPDTDAVFGSVGSLFRFEPSGDIVCTISPPYVPHLLDKMVTLIERWLGLKYHILIFTGMPNWKDADYFGRLDRNQMIRNRKELQFGDFYYEVANENKYFKIWHKVGYTAYVIANYDISAGETFDYIKKLDY